MPRHSAHTDFPTEPCAFKTHGGLRPAEHPAAETSRIGRPPPCRAVRSGPTRAGRTSFPSFPFPSPSKSRTQHHRSSDSSRYVVAKINLFHRQGATLFGLIWMRGVQLRFMLGLTPLSGAPSGMSKRHVKLTVLVLFALLLLCYDGVGGFHAATVPGNSTDMLSLLKFRKAITNDATGALSSWNRSTPFCQWNGVACSRNNPGRVTVLDLGDQGLSGPISPYLGNLTLLRKLNLSSNTLYGQLPPLNRLHALVVLSLRNNSLHDTIPDAIANCSNLVFLELSRNLLVGEIPLKVGLLPNLKILQLYGNDLAGVISPTMSNITSIEFIDFSSNQLTGSIPAELGKLPNLQMLFLGRNRLSGGFPQALLNVSSLGYLGLEWNMLGMALPPNIGYALPYLQSLLLNHNMFEGPIPPSLGNLTWLTLLHLGYNNLQGNVP